MTIRAKQHSRHTGSPVSHFRVQPGQACDLTFQLDDTAGCAVDWEGHDLRFRIFSQYVDQAVVLEVTDPSRCVFSGGGTWRLRLTAEETEALPRGGMRFTLEHRDLDGEYAFGLLGSVSCSEVRSISGPNKNVRVASR